MASVEFDYNGTMTVIQCQENQTMNEICDKFITKSKIKGNEIYYCYDGKVGLQFNKELAFIQMANSLDKTRKKMSILVYDINSTDDNKSKVKSKNIICPECNEDITMNIKNYKINLIGCKNNHKVNKILFNEFENTQMIDLKKIKCGICKNKDKSNSYNNEFYKCYECNINLCPLCKLKHNNKHNIYNYDKINITCEKHNELYTNYCKNCKKNICYLCEEEHNNHEIILLRKMMIDKNELMLKLDELKQSINIFKEDINKIMEILNNVKDYLDYYYKLEEYLFNNYDKNERNYEILNNINELLNFNNTILKDINKDNNIETKFKNINNIYNQIYKNEIKLILNIEKKDINKNIYFLDNTDGPVFISERNTTEEHHHDLLEELNESNVELYINNKKYKYQKYFKPEKEGLYEILLKFNILMKDCSYMFYECKNITNIDLSSFNSQNVTNMSEMFTGCSKLTNIDFSSFDTQNVTNMSNMFDNCYNLTNIDLSSFDIQNVNNMCCMFSDCSKLTNIDLSSFNTKKVTNIEGMFFDCLNLTNIDLSSFDTQNVTNMSDMFDNCSKLKEIKLKNGSKIENVINKEKTKIIFK